MPCPLARYVCPWLLGALALGACAEPVDVGDRPAELTEAPAVSAGASPGLVQVDYLIRDPEGDDQQLDVAVCREDGTLCGAPFQGPGSDGVTFVPTDPTGEPVAHRFIWEAGCGRVNESGRIDTNRSTDYVVRLRVRGVGSSEQTSAPFDLEGLGVGELPECDR